MDNYVESRSDGTQQFDYLVDKVRRSVIFVEQVEAELSKLRLSLKDLRIKRNLLESERILLDRQCETLAAENSLTHERTSVLLKDVEDFLGNVKPERR